MKQSQMAGDNSVQIQASGNVYINHNIESNPLKEALVSVCKKQIYSFKLKDSDTLKIKTKRLSEILLPRSSHQDDLFTKINKGFPGFNQCLLLSQQNNDIRNISQYCENNNHEIEVSSCIWFIGTLAILSYMKYFLQLPITFNFNFPHSGKTAIDLKIANNNICPHVSIIADGPSSLIFQNYSIDPVYIPISFAPPLEHRIIIHKEAHKWYKVKSGLSGEYHVVNNDKLISTPKLHLDFLVKQNKINKNKIKIVDTEPGSQLPIFSDGAADTRSIFCDPMWQVIRLWHPNAFIIHNESYWSDVLIHIEEEFYSNGVGESFLRLFHGCWYDMKFNINNAFNKATNYLLVNTDYCRILLHYCGLK